LNESVVADPEQSTPAESLPSELGAKPVQRQPGKRIDYKDAAKRLMERCKTDARNNQARLDRDRQDWQNHLFYRGGQNQWTVYDKATNSYVARGTDPDQGGLPEWVPRPVTNYFGVKIDGIVSLLNQSEPAKLWSPSTDDDEDRATAEVAQDADPVLLQEIGYDNIRPQLNKLACLSNGALLTLYYDNDPKHGIEGIPVLRCPTCGLWTMPDELDEAGGVCPGEDGQGGCGTPMDAFEPVVGGDGVPMDVPYAKGKVCGAIATSHEYSIPSSARTQVTKELPWVLTHCGMPVDEIVTRWPNAKGRVDKNSTSGGSTQRAYARAVRQLSAPSRASAPVAAAGGGGNSGKNEPIVYILHHDPIDDEDFYFPDGLHAVMVDDILLEAGRLPIQDDEDRPIKTCLIRTFVQGAGSGYGKPPADDLIPIQISYNLTDSLIQLILMHNAAPTTYIPLSVTLENEPSGRPGEHVYYRSVVPGEKPHTEQGTGPHDSLFKYLELLEQRFEVVSKLNSVLTGQAPEGDPTLGQVQILQERGMAAFKEPFDELVSFESDLSRMLLWIAKRTAWSDRMRSVHGENGEWEIRQFNASDLTGKVDVQIEKASAWPKSHLMKMLQVDKALTSGILPPPMQDPELQTKLLTEYGIVDLKPSVNFDRKQIAREIDGWKAAHSPAEIKPPDPRRQDLAAHLFFKKCFVKTEEFEDLLTANPPLAEAMLQHIAQIEMLIQQRQMAAAAAANPQPPQEDTRTAVEKGDRSAVDAAVESGALTPADGQPQPDPMAAALASGALMPEGAAPAPPPGPSIDDLIDLGAMTPEPQETAPPPA
jgi:hypothetical protein